MTVTATKTNDNIINFKGDLYIKSETEEEVILTSLNKTNGKKTVLVFTKDKKLSDKVEEEVAKTVKKTIIHNFFKNDQV